MKQTLLVLTLITLVHNQIIAQTGNEIIKKHIDAMGGAEKWKSIKTIKMTGTMNQMGNEINMSQTFKNDQWFRTDISAAGQNGYMIVTASTGWIYLPFIGQTEPEQMPKEQVELSKDKLNFNYSMLTDNSIISNAVLDGKDTIDKEPCYKLKITTKDGIKFNAFINCKTYFLTKSSTTINTGNGDVEASIQYADYKKQPEGVFIPLTWTSMQGEMHFNFVELNKPYSDDLAKPNK